MEKAPVIPSNCLAKEKSPYLLQHKDNPVDWRAWGEEAFGAAREQNKIIFLSIGYSTCHWCHVMAHDSFEKQEVADLLNKHFISIKVDREERPDIDQIYMEAVMGMTGNGGWPMSVFLTPDLKPFYGGTFFWRPQFLQLLAGLQKMWEADPEKIRTSGKEIADYLTDKPKRAVDGKLDENTLRQAFSLYKESHDGVYGGFGGAPKFPRSTDLSLLLRIHRRSGSPKALDMVEITLDNMARGEIYDAVGGGFHRYATREDWNEPHYEKMLYDNALLVWTYLEAYQIAKKKRYAEVAGQSLDYVLREMTHPGGGFYSAQDAGDVGKEGEYYRLSMQERSKYPLHKDDKILTDWNGLMIYAFAKGYQILGDEKYLKAAQNAARFIKDRLCQIPPGPPLSKGGGGDFILLHRYRDGEGAIDGFVSDYAFLIHGLIGLFESDFDPKWLEWAQELQAKQDELFWDSKEEGYFFATGNRADLIVRKKETHDGAYPSGNSVSALNLLRLHGLTFKKEYRDKVDGIFSALAGEIGRYPAGYSMALVALDYSLDASKEIAVVGPASGDVIRYLHQTFLPNKVLAVSSVPKGEVPLLKGREAVGGKTTFYICENQACRLPTNDFEEAKKLISNVTHYEL